MLSKTHIRIANRILRELGTPLSSEEAAYLRGGSVAPDDWKDFPHHRGKSSNIQRYIIEARKSFLRDDLSKAYFRLGVAFHYLQDGWTTISGSDPKHAQWEQQIERAPFVQNLAEIVESAFSEDQKFGYAELISFLSKEIEGKQATLRLAALQHPKWGNPIVDLNFAFRVSLSVVKSVLGSKFSSTLQTRLDDILKESEIKLKEAEMAFVDRLVELIQKQKELNKRKGIVGLFSRLLGRIYGLRISARIKGYKNRGHLTKVSRAYNIVAKRISAPYSDWYLITIPQLDINQVENEILTLSEASRCLETREEEILDLISKNKISSFRIGENQFARRSEFKNISESERILLKIPQLIENLTTEDKTMRYKAIQTLERMFYLPSSHVRELHEALKMMNRAAPTLSKCVTMIQSELQSQIDEKIQLLLMESLLMAKRTFLEFTEGEYVDQDSLKCKLCSKICKPQGFRSHLARMHPERWKEIRPYDEEYEKYVQVKNRLDAITRMKTLRELNTKARARYEAMGIKKWKWLAAKDSCPICKSLNGKMFPISVTRVPPIHLDCRCTIVPMMESINHHREFQD